MDREIETKTERIVELLERENLGGVLLNAQHNFAWITGGGSNGIDLSRENGAATIFVRRDGKRFLLANIIETPRMLAEEVSSDLFEPIEYSWQDEKAISDLILEKARSLSDSQIASDLTINASLKVIEHLIAPCRFELVPEEIERYKRLGSDAADALDQVKLTIDPGETEIDIAAKMRSELAVKNINSVVTLVAADERISKYRHPVPTENRWNETLLLVTCAKRYGLIASLSRIVCVGDASGELKEKTEAAAFVNATLLNATKLGITGAELYSIALNAYADAGFPDEINRHHQGGATGYKTREWVAHPKSSEVVRVNQAFAWNPSITGTKVEDTIIFTEHGIESITSSDSFATIETEIEGKTFRSTAIKLL